MDVRIDITGATPLVMHNPRLADKEDEFSKAKATVSSKSKKTPADEEEMAHINFLGSLYWDAEIGLYLPTWNILACCIKAAAAFKLGRHVQRAVAQTTLNTPIKHNAPADAEAMWRKPEGRLRKSVVVGQKRITTVRPLFRDWKMSVDLLLMENMLDFDDLVRIVELAGRSEGLGDARKLGYGRFTAKVYAIEEAVA